MRRRRGLGGAFVGGVAFAGVNEPGKGSSPRFRGYRLSNPVAAGASKPVARLRFRNVHTERCTGRRRTPGGMEARPVRPVVEQPRSSAWLARILQPETAPVGRWQATRPVSPPSPEGPLSTWPVAHRQFRHPGPGRTDGRHPDWPGNSARSRRWREWATPSLYDRAFKSSSFDTRWSARISRKPASASDSSTRLACSASRAW